MRKRGKKQPAKPSDKRPFPAVLVRETGKAVLLRVSLPGGDEREIWQPRAAVEAMPGGQWLISESALTEKVQAAVEISKADAAFGKDMLPVLAGEILKSTEKAYYVKLLVTWGTGQPQPWRGFVPMTQASWQNGRLCLSRWIIEQKQAELFAQGVPGPKGGGDRVYRPRPVIEIDSEALAAAIRGDAARPRESTPEQPATPAKAGQSGQSGPRADAGRLF